MHTHTHMYVHIHTCMHARMHPPPHTHTHTHPIEHTAATSSQHRLQDTDVALSVQLLQLDPDDTLHMEAYEKLLDTWLSLVEDTDSVPTALIQPQAAKVFSSYMMCHLSPPHGSRLQVSAASLTACAFLVFCSVCFSFIHFILFWSS